MRCRYYLLISFVVLVSILPSSFAAYLFCSDTDSGLVYNVPGSVDYSFKSNPQTSEKYSVSDYCQEGSQTVQSCSGSNCYLWEYACTGSENNWVVKTESKRCTDLGYTGCQDGACTGASSSSASCSDGIKNQDESDVDCGGVCGRTCRTGKRCVTSADCISSVCGSGVCGEPIQIQPYCLDEDNGNVYVKAQLKYGFNDNYRFQEGVQVETQIEEPEEVELRVDGESQQGGFLTRVSNFFTNVFRSGGSREESGIDARETGLGARF